MACKAGVLRQLAEGPATRLRLMRALEPLDWQPLVNALSWPPVRAPARSMQGVSDHSRSIHQCHHDRLCRQAYLQVARPSPSNCRCHGKPQGLMVTLSVRIVRAYATLHDASGEERAS